jgi:hypothetical protein
MGRRKHLPNPSAGDKIARHTNNALAFEAAK